MSAQATETTRLPWQPCERCGTLGVDAAPDGPILVLACPECAHRETRRRLPFFSLSGPSGSGKSTVVRRLWRLLPECAVLDGDVLWHPAYWHARDAFYMRWLTIAGQISQTGSPVVVCTAAMPDDWATSPARVFVADVHMLALVCDDDDLLARLGARKRQPDEEAGPDFLDETRTFNRWLRERLEHVDTSIRGPDEVAAEVAGWVRARL